MLRNLMLVPLLAISLLVGSSTNALADYSHDKVMAWEGYRGWNKINSHPMNIAAGLWMLCRSHTPEEEQYLREPSKGGFINIFVNDIGRKAMLEQKSPSFPPGTVIVKEKLSSAASDIDMLSNSRNLTIPDSNAPAESLGVMIKVGPGFSKATDDWKHYYVVLGTGRPAIHDDTAHCGSCHAKAKETDDVYRSYLSKEQQSQLK